ncbi:MBL fold metallo-hydrolase [Nocardia callitridis]|uniref:MBL fold metallo-hydrolase n=1 Tax=Nocardia callitridis TaxID=648753 RepID=UPI0031EE458F
MCAIAGLGPIRARMSARLTPSEPPHAPKTTATRRRFFGASAIDTRTGVPHPDRVVLSWVGCTTYALAMGGSVFLLDAWVPRLTSVGYVPATPQDLVDLAPEAIFIGHGHFDHAGDAGAIAEATGAVVYGTAEHGAAIHAQVRHPSFATVGLGDATARPGDRHDFSVGPLEVTAIRHLHSARTAPEHPGGSPRFFPRPQPGVILRHPPTPSAFAQSAARLLDAEGGTVLYQFRVPGFALVWHDSSGPLTEHAPHVLDLLARLPPTDVQIGAVQGYNQISNGLRDPRRYIEAIAPGVFVPSHHDNWLPGLTASAATYDGPLRTEFERLSADPPPRLHTMHDPDDYLHPERLTFPL